ncbi:hypothetical protein SCHPADRAFT_940638 [Schizopora paradoxa]|uniref:Uncharacterized protein n=1 Tax=Schizopora paradoxa TaxID=27342 RepID=A0A0H2RUQ2_9AGAM|nr:hypothetical protein SCHPADRAFT_940638 [Schizopora paradoxa]
MSRFFQVKSSEDVIFTSDRGISTLLTASKAIKSREAVGVWIFGGKVWKVFSHVEKSNGRTQILGDLQNNYELASRWGLPIGKCTFMPGKVQVGKNIATNGFVLVTEEMAGTNFQKSKSSFIAALKKEGVPKNKYDADYQKILAACMAAKNIGLKDCQGFIKTGVREPLRFIDVHTGWNKCKGCFDDSGQAVALLEAIEAWPTMK